MQLLKQLQPGLHVPNVAESVLQTSVSAVIFVAIVDRKTDTPALQRHGRNRPTTTSKQANINIATAKKKVVTKRLFWVTENIMIAIVEKCDNL